MFTLILALIPILYVLVEAVYAIGYFSYCHVAEKDKCYEPIFINVFGNTIGLEGLAVSVTIIFAMQTCLSIGWLCCEFDSITTNNAPAWLVTWWIYPAAYIVFLTVLRYLNRLKKTIFKAMKFLHKHSDEIEYENVEIKKPDWR